MSDIVLGGTCFILGNLELWEFGIETQLIHRLVMVNGSWLKANGSCLEARSSRLKAHGQEKIWRWVPHARAPAIAAARGIQQTWSQVLQNWSRIDRTIKNCQTDNNISAENELTIILDWLQSPPNYPCLEHDGGRDDKKSWNSRHRQLNFSSLG